MKYRQLAKVLAIAVSMLLIVGIMGACGTQGTPTQGTATAQPGATAAPQGSGSTTPQTEERPTITYWEELWVGKQSTLLASLDDSLLYQEVQDRLNVEIEFQHPPAGQAKEKFNVMVSSQSLTDIVEYGLAGYPGGAEKAIEDGVVLDLTNVLPEKAPYVSKVMADHPDWAKGAYTDAGVIYSFPFFRGHDALLTWSGPQARKDILDKAGIAPPETIGDWYEAATKLKAEGYAEYPVLFTNLANIGDTSIFPGGWGVGWEYYVKPDLKTIGYGPIEPEFKEFIAEMAKWFSEGLIDPDVVVGIEGKDRQSKISTGKSLLFHDSVGGGMGFYYGSIKREEPTFELIGLTYPTVDGSIHRFGRRDPNMSGLSYWISAKTTQLDACIKVLDYGYSDEGHELFNFGVEGVSFDWVDKSTIDTPIDISMTGDKYPLWKPELITNNPNYAMADALGPYVRSHGGGPFVQDVRYLTQFMQFPDQLTAIGKWTSTSDFSGLLNYVYATPAESDIVAEKQSAMNTYRDEMLIQFISGDKPMSDWDAFVTQMKAMGAEDLLKIRQDGYERMLNR